jgi:signal transduction histidine kinase
LADVGRHPHSYGFPVNHPRMKSFLGVPVMLDGIPFGNLYLTEKDSGAEFSDEDEQQVLLLAEYAAIAVDHARRFGDVERERAELAQTVEALRATTDITRAVAGEDDVDAILEMIAKRGRALVSARVMVIELVDHGELVVAAAAGEIPFDFIGQRLPIEGSVAGAAIRTRTTQRLSENLNRFQQYGAGRLGVTAADGLVVPMVFRGEVVGALVALDMEERPRPGAGQQRLLEAFANSAAMAVGTAQSAADQRRREGIAATEAERGRWARELHDDTLQALAGIRLALASARKTGDPERVAEAVDGAIEQLQVDMDSLRSLISDLRPGALDELGVEPAILDLADRFAQTGIELDVSVEFAHEDADESTRLVPELETAIYRTVQEALTNIGKHSGARRAVVEIVEADGIVRLSVRDDGNGFDPDSRSSGFGLVGMRERAGLAGGKLAISSEPGHGATITAEFPVRRNAPETARFGQSASG